MRRVEQPATEVERLAQRAHDALKRGDKHGVDVLQSLCEEGVAPAQVILGWACETGRGISVDLETARRWYFAAANAGDPVGQYYLAGFLARHGAAVDGVPWLIRAACQRYVPAMYQLGRLYEHGMHVDRDELHGSTLIAEAAALGHPRAQRALAVRRLRGNEGIAGFLRGLLWFAAIPYYAVKLASYHDKNLGYP